MVSSAARLESLFAAASERSEAARAAFLERECAGDAELLRELLALLESDTQFASATARKAFDLEGVVDALDDESRVGQRVGPFELREAIGEGGMGSVYRAERVDGAVQQVVAIKFVRRERLDAQMLRRFRLERQVLASLKHPYIARLLDASALPDGTPYFVMEYVDGVPITTYCARERLGLRERVALLRKVCGAVAEAHRELVVHRDLKPTNLLITAAGEPKLLDFGIAKPLGDIAGVSAEETGTGQRCFSPCYAAPEQLVGASVGVACDVYALGQLLFELIVGARPFDITNLSPGQIERLILHVPPDAPSAALARRPAHMPAIRPRALRGDLDGIVLKCLRKDPHERYASVEQLEADLGNYLEGRPVRARGGHAWYRAQKFVRRNTAAVIASALTLAALVAGVGAVAWEARIARERAHELEQVASFQGTMLAGVDPGRAGEVMRAEFQSQLEKALDKGGASPRERDARLAAFAAQWRELDATGAARKLVDEVILHPAAEAIDRQFKQQPVVGAALRQVLADRYREIEMLDAAEPLQNDALAARRRELGDNHRDTLRSLEGLGALRLEQGRLPEAETILHDLLARRSRAFGPDDHDTLDAQIWLSQVFRLQGRFAEAEALTRDSLARIARTKSSDDPDALIERNNLGLLLRLQGRYAEAEPYLREALEAKRRVLGADAPSTLISLNNYATLLLNLDRPGEAEPLLRAALASERRVFGNEHGESLLALNNLGLALRDEGRPAEGEPLTREALAISRRVQGPDHPVTLMFIDSLGVILASEGRHGEAAQMLAQAVAKRRATLGESSPETLKSITALGATYVAMGRHADAVALLAPVEGVVREKFRDGNEFRVARFLVALGAARGGAGEFATAERLLLDAQALLASAPTPKPRDAQECRSALAALYVAWDVAEPGRRHARADGAAMR